MKQSWKGSVLLAPVPPVLVSCGDLEHPNVLTVAWTGVLNTRPPMTYISLRPERYSYELIQKSRCFCINLPTAALVKAVDFCGCRSGRQVDKFSHCGLTPAPSQEIEAPMVEQSPVSLECRVKDIVPLGTHHMFTAEIVRVNVEESLLDQAGKLDLSKAGLLAYAHGEYFALGKKLGKFGDSVRKKRKKRNEASPSRPKRGY